MEQPTHRQGLIDTDILIDASRGFQPAGEFLETISRDDALISAITAMELITGCRDAAQLASVKEFVASFAVLPLTEQISACALSLVEGFTLSHGLLLPDALVAATALQSNIALYTRNTRHYRMIPKLLIIQPY